MLEVLPTWTEIKKIIQLFGWAKGVLTIFFFISHFWIYRMYSGRLADRQKEINRLAKDNKEYRDRFLQLLDNKFDLNKE